MKKRFDYLIAIMILASLVFACNYGKDDLPELPETEIGYDIQLPETMPDDFEIRFLFGYDVSLHLNGVDTMKNEMMKDLVLDGLATEHYLMTLETKTLIYSKLKDIEILNYPAVYKPLTEDDQEGGVVIHPSDVYELTLSFEDVTYHLSWQDVNGSKTPDAVRLREVLYRIRMTIEQDDTFIKLGMPNGGYD